MRTAQIDLIIEFFFGYSDIKALADPLWVAPGRIMVGTAIKKKSFNVLNAFFSELICNLQWEQEFISDSSWLSLKRVHLVVKLFTNYLLVSRRGERYGMTNFDCSMSLMNGAKLLFSYFTQMLNGN